MATEKFDVIRPYWFKYVIVFSLLVVTAGFASLVPYSFSIIIDKGLIGHQTYILKIILPALGIGAVLVIFLGIWRDYVYAELCSDILARVRSRIFQHLQKLSMDFYTKTEPGEILSRFSSDLTVIEDAILYAKWSLFIPGLNALFNVILLFFLDWKLALIALVIFPASIIGPKFFSKPATEAGHRRKECEAETLSRVSENIMAQTVVKALNLQNISVNRFEEGNRRLKKNMIRSFFFSSLINQSGIAGLVILEISILSVGSYMVYAGSLEIGKLVAFQTLLMGLSEALTTIIDLIPMCMQAFVGVERIKSILQENPRVLNVPDAVEIPSLKKEITFKGVSFGYTRQQVNLDNINLSISRGISVAFVGASGSGKSTILTLLMRFYDPDSGAVSIDGVDLKAATQESLRSQLGIVLQDNILFNISVRENLRLARPDATDEEIEEAAKKAEIHDFIKDLPEGYETVAGERGSRFSGGQRQRLAIARALLRSGDILIFDEATSALDPASEAAINETLSRIAQSGRTIISVTHRLASIANANKIFVMDKGKLAESGTHQELLAFGGIYKGLWEKQGGFKKQEDGFSFAITPERLRRIPYFECLAEDEELLRKMAAAFVTEQYSQDHIVIRQGDFSLRFFVIVRGTAEVTITDEEDIVQQYDVFRDGDYFGEMSLLKKCNVWTLVRTLTPCIFLTLRREDFVEVMEKNHELREKIENRLQIPEAFAQN
ncbi:MAG: hypothetical protein A2017_05755 [Lentisphaerae bacterium GWF2_44_16]|nr:MAG: hypothetical protein A2017_05755 [Lentisphaerae bacterium GWF2_44_16]